MQNTVQFCSLLPSAPGRPSFTRRRESQKEAFNGVLLRRLIVQNHIEQRLVNLDAAVVFNEAELAKAVHEEADAGSGGADHFRQGLLSDLGDQCFRFTRLAEFRH